MIKIVTDSSVTIEPTVLQELGISVVPLSVMIDGMVYSDNDLKDEGKFLALMKEAKHLPKTSQPSVGLFAEVYQNLHQEGADTIISIHLPQTLSGTIEAARQGAILSGVKVEIIDSNFTDQALAFQVIEAARLAKSGASLEMILNRIDEIRQKTDLYLGVSTLENLIKGGRIGRVTGILSHLLNIKVMMWMQDSHLSPIAKGRGQKTFRNWLSSFKEEMLGKRIAELAISYSGSPDFALAMRDDLQELTESPIRVLETGSIIQTHTGEDAFAVMVRYD